MKHEKIWHTCDRCGREIKPLYPWNRLLTTKVPIIIQTREQKVHTYRSDVEVDIDRQYGTRTLNLVYTTYDKNIEGKLELCGNCKKDFEKFMKNKEI